MPQRAWITHQRESNDETWKERAPSFACCAKANVSTDEDTLSSPSPVKRFLASYRAKRLLGFLFANSQSVRWLTQGRILGNAASEVRRPGQRALDVGCGGGSYAIENHLRKGTQATLCDYDGDLVAMARKQVAESGVTTPAEFAECSADALPFGDGLFDFIQCMEVLEHLNHPEKALAEFLRVAKDGARMVISVPHPPEWFPNPGHVVEGYRAPDITRLVEAAGWRVIRVEYCMLILTRLVGVLLHYLRIPLPLNPLLMLENFVPNAMRLALLPYDIVVIAEKVAPSASA